MTTTYLQDRIFGNDSEKLIRKFLEYMRPLGEGMSDAEKIRFAKNYVEISVLLGALVAYHKPAAFVEIGCGLAIPSLTLVKMGITSGNAFDIEHRVHWGRELASDLGLTLECIERDFYQWDADLPKGTFLIADKPGSVKKNDNKMESDIVRLAIKLSLNIALIPYLGKSKHILRRCAEYARKLNLSQYRTDYIVYSMHSKNQFDTTPILIGIK